MKKGIFITFEGIDGCGKSTQSKLIYDYLKKNGHKVVYTREPGGTKFAEYIRNILLNPKNQISPLAELFLYESGRAEHVKRTILPAIKSKSIIICDRFFDATIAYQGYGRGLDIKMIEKLNYFASQGIIPDLTILLDISASEGLKRVKKLKKNDRMEKEKISFYNKVRRGYLLLAKKFPKR
ncbi:MAG: dTMP kinase, partial [Elusimicrobia bacterium]|nr:dTMP kinase [Elusimicrobiota bacterium]